MKGDILSAGTVPEGDNRDTPIGGVSRLSRHPRAESVPVAASLTVIESGWLIDGEAEPSWSWVEADLDQRLFLRDPELWFYGNDFRIESGAAGRD